MRQANRPCRAGSLITGFQHEEVPEPWPARNRIHSLLVSLPKIRGISESFFNPVVKIVSEATNLRFHLNCGNELPVGDYQQIPLFGRTEKTGQRSRSFIGG